MAELESHRYRQIAGAALEEMGGRFTVSMITVAITAAARPSSV